MKVISGVNKDSVFLSAEVGKTLVEDSGDGIKTIFSLRGMLPERITLLDCLTLLDFSF